jgi:lauroyl/myristoyl acyltransferase
MIALLGDRDFGTFGEPMMFLGRKTLIPKGAAFFSYKTGAPIVPVFLIPEGDGKYVLTLYPAIEPDVTRDQKDEIFSLMERSTSVIEEKIRQDPSQWMMFRDFGVDHEHLYSHTGV